MYAKEARKYGFVIVISTRNISDVSPKVLSNLSGTVIILRMANAREARTIGEDYDLPDSMKESIPNQGVGVCIVVTTFSNAGAEKFKARIIAHEKEETVEITGPGVDYLDWERIHEEVRV